MRKMEKIKVRGLRIPNFIFYLKGRIHSKRGLFTIESETVRSPFLLGMRYAYSEYREKLLKTEEEILLPLKMELSKVEVEKKLESEKLEIIEVKLSKLEEPCSGAECRRKMQLEKDKENTVLKLAEVHAKMQQIEENIMLVKQLAMHLLTQNLALIQSKAYTYILGANGRMEKNKYYLESKDITRDIFCDLIPSTI